MSWVVAPATDLKVAYFVGVSPSTTKISLGRQTMMCSVTWRHLLTSRACVHGAEEPMVTEICTNVTLGGGRAGAGALDKDMGRRGSNPLTFGNLDADGVISSWFIDYWGGSR